MFTLSDLPLNTTVESDEYGYWTKYSEKTWFDENYHCVDCQDSVSEEGTDKPQPYQPGPTIGEKAEDYLSPYTIISIPVTFIETYLKEKTDA